MGIKRKQPTDPTTIGQMIAERSDIVHSGGDWFVWRTTHWETVEGVALKQFVSRAAGEVSGERGTKRTQYTNILHALEEEVELVDEMGSDPQTISLQNGLLDVVSGELRPHDPKVRNVNALPFSYDHDAGEPVEWLAFLMSVWGDKPDLIDFLQLWMGYQLTTDTSQQRFVNLNGPPRSGKGTIAHVMTQLIGKTNVGALQIEGIGARFGLTGAIGKLSLIMSETRIGYTDKDAVANKLLQITGEDVVEVDRKYSDPWIGQLPGRITVLSNDPLKLKEPVLLTRMIILPMTESFVGREDTGLKGRLDKELPAIFLWALKGCQRVLDGERLKQPESGMEAREDQADAMKGTVDRFLDEMIIDTSETKGEAFMTNDSIVAAYRRWCNERGDQPIQRDAVVTAIRGSRRFQSMQPKGGGKRGFWVKLRDNIPI